MTPQEAEQRLAKALVKDPAGRYSICCKKQIVLLRLRGESKCFRYGVRDQASFLPEVSCLVVEHTRFGIVRRRFQWDQIECLLAGEPETDQGTLFQG